MKKIKLTQNELTKIISKIIKEDAGMDTPGGNPDYFYGDGSLEKIRKFAQQQDETEISTQDIVDELKAIYSYSQDGATDLVNDALENLLYSLGGFKDDVNEQEIGRKIDTPKSVWHMDEKNDLMSKVDDIHRILTTPSKAWNK